MKGWEIQICGFVYDEADGMRDEGIAPGTRWEGIPDAWVCPNRGTAKGACEMVELVVREKMACLP